MLANKDKGIQGRSPGIMFFSSGRYICLDNAGTRQDSKTEHCNHGMQEAAVGKPLIPVQGFIDSSGVQAADAGRTTTDAGEMTADTKEKIAVKTTGEYRPNIAVIAEMDRILEKWMS